MVAHALFRKHAVVLAQDGGMHVADFAVCAIVEFFSFDPHDPVAAAQPETTEIIRQDLNDDIVNQTLALGDIDNASVFQSRQTTAKCAYPQGSVRIPMQRLY